MKKRNFVVLLLTLVFMVTSIGFAQDLKSGDESKEVKALQNQLKTLGYFDGQATGYFGPATKQALKRYQALHGIIATGVLDAVTKKSLAKSMVAVEKKKNTAASRGTAERKAAPVVQPLTSTAKANGQAGSTTNNTALNDGKKAAVELLDWWTEVGKVFPREAEAVVYDIKTGKRFKIKRTYGGNHADCETLTKEDTAMMKEVWGGEWSWERRPVLVEIDGRRLAASMTGMPHAGLDAGDTNATVDSRSGGFGKGINLDAVKGNGMDGHFDIHFLNSRTHGTNKVDTKHQEVVMEAAKAE